MGYYEEGGCLWAITSRDRTWWKNPARRCGSQDLLLKRKPATAFAEPDPDETVGRGAHARITSDMCRRRRNRMRHLASRTAMPNAE
ncbi:MAG: hypothetical protein MZV70_17915 [Desulfobacterales bacterium]|nr:hypothetical protein [Desulfobacterales bacterium]